MLYEIYAARLAAFHGSALRMTSRWPTHISSFGAGQRHRSAMHAEAVAFHATLPAEQVYYRFSSRDGYHVAQNY